MEEKELQNFIDVIVRKSENNLSSDRPLTRKEMEELALSMGLTQKQFRELMVKSIKHTQTAKRFLDQENFENGILEAQSAININPYVDDGYSLLALGYFQRFQANEEESDRIQAEFAANKALKSDANDLRAINVLSALSKAKQNRKSNRKSSRIILAALISVMLVGVAAFFFTTSEADKKEADGNAKNLLIEAEESVNSIEMEIRVEEIRKKNLMIEFLAIGPGDTEEQSQLKKELSDFLFEKNQDKIDEKFMQYKSVLPTELSDAIQTHLIQIEGAENRIAFQRGELAKAIKNYNILVKRHGSDYPEFKLKEYE